MNEREDRRKAFCDHPVIESEDKSLGTSMNGCSADEMVVLMGEKAVESFCTVTRF